ncbi:MAG: DNA mismatch repair endonuclease MutL [Bacteroidia bacterium]
MAQILRLPEKTANQIAAGEVVQRPASVVKELMENAIDAKADTIKLFIKNGGCTHIQVEDNGIGMNEKDAIMCWERHATSKISKAEDLYNLTTLGFRGEALASIASVSDIHMKTRTKDADKGLMLHLKAGQIMEQEAVAHPVGTSITIKNLFYNIPARKNFLKSISSETKHIIDEFQRIALSHPELAFEFFNQDKLVYKLKAASLSSRIAELLNINEEELIACNEETEIVNIHGYVGSPKLAKKTRGLQFLFANGRYIRDHYLNHAIKTAYAGIIDEKQFPFFLLVLDVDPGKIDVNIHPTKHEVKFQDAQHVYSLILSVVKKCLSQFYVLPTPEELHLSVPSETQRDAGAFSTSEPNPRFNPFGSSKQKTRTEWEKLDELLKSELPQERVSQQQFFEELSSDIKAEGSIFQLNNTYIIYEHNGELWLINQHRAHEQVLYERYKRSNNKTISSQQLLFPRTLELSNSDFLLVHEVMDQINQLGFDISDFGKDSIIINGLPAELSKEDGAGILRQIIDDFKENQLELKSDKKEALIRATAKNAAIKSGLKLNDSQMRQLVSDLLHCKTNNRNPSGAAIVVKFDGQSLAGFFRK